MATRLEKLANKGKEQLNGSSPLPAPSAKTKSPPPPPPAPAVKSPEKRPPKLTTSGAVPKETYLVSGCMRRQIINLIQDVLAEGREFAASKILAPPLETSSPPGTVLLQAASSILDIYRAVPS